WSAGLPADNINTIIDTDIPNAPVVNIPGAETRFLTVGENDTGTLNVRDGGTVSSSTGHIGRYFGSNGTVKMTGAGSTWDTYQFYVGNGGSGELIAEAGGGVSANNAHIGYSANSVGT